MTKLLNISDELAKTLNKARHEFKNPYTDKPASYTVAIEQLIGEKLLREYGEDFSNEPTKKKFKR